MKVELRSPSSSEHITKRYSSGAKERAICKSEGFPDVEVYFYEDGNVGWESQINKEGRYHGTWMELHSSGEVSHIGSYINGIEHGIFLQFGREGALIGSYCLVDGTGKDVWMGQEGSYVSEEHNMKNGIPHGLEGRWSGYKDHLMIQRHEWQLTGRWRWLKM